MNRVDVIKALVGRKTAALPKPKGMAHPGEKAETRQRFRYKPAKYGQVFHSFGLVRTPVEHGMAWDKDADSLKKGAGFKASERKGVHHLTRIAEKMKRGWHKDSSMCER